MIEWLMIFLGGLLGSSHCVGMCGGFALALGIGQRHWAANLGRQLLYGLGRVFTYTSAGAMTGYGGWRLTAECRDVINLQAVLCMVAGTLLIVQGLRCTGVLRWTESAPYGSGTFGSSCFATLLRAGRLHNVFLGGVINGMLPCSLVYAFLALAASTGQMALGALTMLLFGLGTLPVMVAVGAGGALLSIPLRQRMFMLAAWCVVLTGAISLWRGIAFLDTSFLPGAGCPGCP
jgi:sulfite exporter TauE/SafE